MAEIKTVLKTCDIQLLARHFDKSVDYEGVEEYQFDEVGFARAIEAAVLSALTPPTWRCCEKMVEQGAGNMVCCGEPIEVAVLSANAGKGAPSHKRGTIDTQIETLRRKWPQAHAQSGINGEHLIIVPSVRLPHEFGVTIGTLLFIAPSGFFYHGTTPSNFWIDIPNIRVNGKKHYSPTDDNPIPGFPAWSDVTRFRWNLQAWNPNQDTLLTVVHAILQSLESASKLGKEAEVKP